LDRHHSPGVGGRTSGGHPGDVTGSWREGIKLQFSGPIEIRGGTGPQELRVLLTVPEGIRVEAGGEAQASLRTTLEGVPCPNCGDGVMVPVRWNPFTGDITWKCPVCGYILEESH